MGTNFEIQTSDLDISQTNIRWYADGEEVFIEQVDVEGNSKLILFNRKEAVQVHAILSAFVKGDLKHASDCALFNSPALPIGPCTCKK